MANQIQIEKRLKELRSKLKKMGLDGALITKRENYIYLSNFTGTFANLLITQEKAMLVTDFRYVEQARNEVPSYEIIQFQGNLATTLNDLLTSHGVRNLGFEEDYMTFKTYDDLGKKLGSSKLVPLDGAVELLRIIKDQDEVEVIKEAVRVADGAFSHILKFIKPGVTEIEVASEIEHYFKKQGARGPSFDTIVASGVRSSLPHGVASSKVIEMGDAVTLDFGAIYKEYCSDMTRTVFVGQPKDELKKIYGIVLKAQKAALIGAAKGLKGKEIDRIAREVIAEAGFGENFGHSLGHGVGIEIHEEPRLSPQSITEMKNGMVVTVEPGIYVSGLGGVRIEDMIVINNDKPLVLTGSTKDMIVL
ncbi:M24 family metallopeptidase [Acetivibrio cellulolyticus]|uniref:M24 family metallopeptidase n=1 Tax=Acetivibrio cellulolyticus TaxID=35830 RepID=UPI0001E2DE56|nr:aminopeptidase P family protein [Acetivibrio cellulolyticus]